MKIVIRMRDLNLNSFLGQSYFDWKFLRSLYFCVIHVCTHIKFFSKEFASRAYDTDESSKRFYTVVLGEIYNTRNRKLRWTRGLDMYVLIFFIIIIIILYVLIDVCALCAQIARRTPTLGCCSRRRRRWQMLAAAPLTLYTHTHTHEQVCIIYIIIRKQRSHTRTKYDWCSDHDRMNILGMRHYDAGLGYIYY